MSFFSKSLKTGKELSKIGNSFVIVKTILDKLSEEDEEVEEFEDEDWYTIAWICRVGIIDVIEKNNFPLYFNLYATINGHLTKLTIQEVVSMSVGRLSIKATNLDRQTQENISNILEKGSVFYEIDKIIPDEIRAIDR